ncbi:cyclic lactone autoinducer peptide [[Ruminococcus] gnavus]|jgi:AgrD protein|uniref:Cyclic lactone autoinducer peptide n=2 Tax=Lachnospiraceae TaxID=186803 RepID=A0AAJ1AYS5_MEDGN|nr:cyclic lactone autoinducer peptide [Mediterraneibacter gnavus]MBN2921861.1 cyclic lactone autoinducer peptide [Lactobacillus sp.]MCB5493667.1 cyclic lactone autoinducer peptide [Mediterraneibacter gnavus]MCB5592911.1 cyclic lactone autoinducer peptide [Mediterraneibacter gnavus]MCB5605634.1 cyclic lactone autoinducer peptide [Mediterraneibacter gnavus]MCG4523814.1 cyclic lactone autoinducer peptide [Mediterraneibacter gnavus]
MNQKKINSSKKLSAEILAGASLKMSKMAANSACCYIYHQPKMPAALKNMRKF